MNFTSATWFQQVRISLGNKFELTPPFFFVVLESSLRVFAGATLSHFSSAQEFENFPRFHPDRDRWFPLRRLLTHQMQVCAIAYLKALSFPVLSCVIYRIIDFIELLVSVLICVAFICFGLLASLCKMVGLVRSSPAMFCVVVHRPSSPLRFQTLKTHVQLCHWTLPAAGNNEKWEGFSCCPNPNPNPNPLPIPNRNLNPNLNPNPYPNPNPPPLPKP